MLFSYFGFDFFSLSDFNITQDKFPLTVFNKLTQLETLDISNNHLQKFPSKLRLPNLKVCIMNQEMWYGCRLSGLCVDEISLLLSAL